MCTWLWSRGIPGTQGARRLAAGLVRSCAWGLSLGQLWVHLHCSVYQIKITLNIEDSLPFVMKLLAIAAVFRYHY